LHSTINSETGSDTIQCHLVVGVRCLLQQSGRLPVPHTPIIQLWTTQEDLQERTKWVLLERFRYGCSWEYCGRQRHEWSEHCSCRYSINVHLGLRYRHGIVKETISAWLLKSRAYQTKNNNNNNKTWALVDLAKHHAVCANVIIDPGTRLAISVGLVWFLLCGSHMIAQVRLVCPCKNTHHLSIFLYSWKGTSQITGNRHSPL